MNYLRVSQELAEYRDPGSAAGYDSRIGAIGVVMELLTFALFASFGAVMIKQAVVKARATNFKDLRDTLSQSLSRRSRGQSAAPAEAPRIAAEEEFDGVNPMLRRQPPATSRGGVVEMTATNHPAPPTRDRQISVEIMAAASDPLPSPAPSAKPPARSALLAAGWQSHTMDDGGEYYYNAGTGETTWVKPTSA